MYSSRSSMVMQRQRGNLEFLRSLYLSALSLSGIEDLSSSPSRNNILMDVLILKYHGKVADCHRRLQS